MTSTTEAVQILKTDVLGRVRTPRARREEILDEFERSGLRAVEGVSRIKLQDSSNSTAIDHSGLDMCVNDYDVWSALNKKENLAT